MPWTGAAFLVGAMAIAGLPPLNGFASEWLTLQALIHVPMSGGVGAGLAGSVALAALAATAALAVLCFVKVDWLVLLGPSRRAALAEAAETPIGDACRHRPAGGGVRRARGGARRAVRGARRLGAVGGDRLRRASGCTCPAPVPCRPPGSRWCWSASRRRWCCCGVVCAPPRRRLGPAGSAVEPALRWTSAGFTKPIRLVLESILRPEREITTSERRRGRAGGRLRRSGAAPDRRSALPARCPAVARRRRHTRADCRAAGSAPTSAI